MLHLSDESFPLTRLLNDQDSKSSKDGSYTKNKTSNPNQSSILNDSQNEIRSFQNSEEQLINPESTEKQKSLHPDKEKFQGINTDSNVESPAKGSNLEQNAKLARNKSNRINIHRV